MIRRNGIDCMRTPKEYTDNLKKKIITTDMLAASLFSINKRAKNCRDKEREYRNRGKSNRYYCDTYNNEEKYREQKEYYYRQKERLLALLSPTCIHREVFTKCERYYDYEPDFWELFETHDVVREGEYYDNEIKDYVKFIDIKVEDYRYYLFYALGDYSFHTPIGDDMLKSYPELEVRDINELVTCGKNTTELVSMQFVKKMLDLIDAGDYQLCCA